MNEKLLIIFASVGLSILITTILLSILNRLFVYKNIMSSKVHKDLEKILTDENYQNQQIENIELNKENLKITQNYIEYTNITSKDNNEKKVLIFFPGSGVQEYEEILKYIQNINKNSKDKFDKIIIPHYPKQCLSFSSIGKNGEKMINNLLKDNYKPENIDIFGYSLGVAIANSVVSKYEKKFQKENKKFNSIVHYNGFSNMADTSKTKLHLLIRNQFLQKLCTFIMDFFILGFHFNNAKIIENKNFPVNKQIIVSSEKDRNIPKNISLSEKIKNTKNRNIVIYESKNSDHFDIKYEQIFDILGTKEIHDENFVKKS